MLTYTLSFKKRILFTVIACTFSSLLLGGAGVAAAEYWLTEESHFTQNLSIYLSLFIVLSSISLLLTTWAVNRAIQIIAKPLDDIRKTTSAVIENTYSERRVDPCNLPDLQAVVSSFNAMLDTFAHEKFEQQATENRFRSLTAHAPIGIFQLDNKNKLVYANDHWYRITETHGELSPWAAHQNKISANDNQRYRSNWNHSAQKNIPILLEYQYQKDSGGQAKFLMENITPLLAGTGSNGMIGTLTDVTEIKNAQIKLEKLAFYDALTGLPNRRFFSDLLGFGLAKAKRSNNKAAVLMIDLDNFKRVNDLLGHAGGDQLLQKQAQRIRAAVREEDAVSRMSGDEFTVMLSPVHEISEVTRLAKRIMDALNTPVVIGNHTLDLGASIGVALYPNDGKTVDELIRNADMALYEAKGDGRNRVNFFSYKLDLELRESVRIEQKLKYVIQRQGLQVFLQPQVSGDGKVLWAEALVRWFDEDEGPISPSRFIPLAEETGLIHDIGQWVLEQVCLNLSENKKALQAVGIHGVSVNLSARQFYSRTLLKDIRNTILEYNIDPESLEFELTESSVMDDVDIAVDVMRGIQELGCKIAIDDFGTGYSSLACLQRFPINNLKIDRSFVVDIPHDGNGSTIATAIIAMAHKLGLGVVAEGVETIEQQNFLIDQGCELLQGYLFSKPENIKTHVDRGRDILFSEGGQIIKPH